MVERSKQSKTRRKASKGKRGSKVSRSQKLEPELHQRHFPHLPHEILINIFELLADDLYEQFASLEIELTHNNLKCCMLVNRAWFSLATPIAWRHRVVLREGEFRAQLLLGKEAGTTTLAYAAFVHSLSFGYDLSVDCLVAIVSRCPNLRQLIQLQRLGDTFDPVFDVLLTHCPSFEYLEMSRYQQFTAANLAKPLAARPLKKLVVRVRNFGPKALDAIITQLGPEL
ncbi:hypothetical protein HK102_010423 [Quaeritorhiza haematococci]|nr:hypothetical protein HK102_010423 [Quaeritorhiza haematococci]